ncbi:porin [Pontibacter qinzhouensis]|uniref:Porin n=1 Tax=Pontibacter qinzhouensis TaxID=2603253 RepID=A0A5C8JGW2_9BACT|nr:porin [Pontibacter qinzhouensis]TXK36848.1 porin [Pontibacter qinzhouensis]
MRIRLLIALAACVCIRPVASLAQAGTPHQVKFSQKTGVGIIAPDSIFSLNLRFRIQNRAIYFSNPQPSLSQADSDFELRVRRLRLRLEGFMLSPKLTYLVQLSFSRGDMDWSMRDNSAINTSPNVVRDAVIYYRPTPELQLFFGQTKLPGNRQRVISSGDQQFVDRSIVNVAFNIDRDFGFQAYYTNHVGGFYYIIKSALTSGEGRNVITTNKGLAYTGRLELLPFGKFTNEGDYFEGDLEREPNVKVSLAGGLSHNRRARRAGGQIGRDLYQERDLRTYIFDGLVKYQGLAVFAEHMARNTENPFTESTSGDSRHVITGHGQNFQVSYLFRNNIEIASRYARVTPAEAIRAVERQEESYVAGVTKYLRRHRVKLQANVSYITFTHMPTSTNSDTWSAALQFELGI